MKHKMDKTVERLNDLLPKVVFYEMVEETLEDEVDPKLKYACRDIIIATHHADYDSHQIDQIIESDIVMQKLGSPLAGIYHAVNLLRATKGMQFFSVLKDKLEETYGIVAREASKNCKNCDLFEHNYQFACPKHLAAILDGEEDDRAYDE
jgi:hypothetical protein